jgi:hypothetical protein
LCLLIGLFLTGGFGEFADGWRRGGRRIELESVMSTAFAVYAALVPKPKNDDEAT